REATQFGSPTIETEHLLLGLICEDEKLMNRFLRNHPSIDSVRKEIEGWTVIREQVSTSIDLPFSNECRRIIAYAAEEAERLNSYHIGTEHVLLGVFREEKCVAAKILQQIGLRLNAIREEFSTSSMYVEPQVNQGSELKPAKSGHVPDADTAKRIAE